MKGVLHTRDTVLLSSITALDENSTVQARFVVGEDNFETVTTAIIK